MTTTAITGPLLRASVADTDSGVPRFQTNKTEPPTQGDEKTSNAKSPPSTEEKPAANATVRRTTIDWETGSVVYRVIDEHSGRTVSQSPEEALLRLRAYVRQNEVVSSTSASTDESTATSGRSGKSV